MTARPADGQRSSIVAVHPHADLYGSDRMFLETVMAVGPDVTVVVPRTGPLTESLAAAGVPVLLRPFPVLRKVELRNPLRVVQLLVALVVSVVSCAWWLRRRRVRTLYVSTVAAPAWLAAGRLAGARVVCHVHESEPQLGRLASRVLLAPLAAATSVIANSTDCLQWIRASVGRRVGRRATVVHNGVRESGSGTPSAPDAGNAHLVVVGRLATRKGQDVAIRAASLVARAGHDVRLTLVGDSYPGYEDVSDGYRALAAELGIAGRVSFVGFTDPHPHVRAADVVLVPSRVEPFGLVAVEGMLQGRPVIASAVGGLPEIIDDGRTGLLVPAEDPDALAAAILRLLDDPETARRLATAGQSDARARFSIESYAATIRELVGAV